MLPRDELVEYTVDRIVEDLVTDISQRVISDLRQLALESHRDLLELAFHEQALPPGDELFLPVITHVEQQRMGDPLVMNVGGALRGGPRISDRRISLVRSA